MTKNKTIYLWGFLLLFLGIVNSCRNDFLQEQHIRNEAKNFEIFSKTISLNESKHKQKLLPELKQVKSKLASSFAKNASAKVINYGDSISINTDEVIYVEYKAYHTYTFRLHRNRADENTPVENLILSLEPDGTYKEFLNTYQLSIEDQETLSIGGEIDFSGKTNILEVEKGTYGNNILMKTGGYNDCHWEAQTFVKPCACHPGHTNIASCNCTKGKPVQFVINVLVCEESGDNTDISEIDPGGISHGGANGGPVTGGNEPNPNEVQEAIDELGGVITLPNLPLETEENKTDCERLKEKTDDTVFKAKLDSIKGRVTQTNPDEHETSFTVEKHKNKITYSVTSGSATILPDGTKVVKNTMSNYDIAGAHNHPPESIPIFSHKDIVTLYEHYKMLVPFRKNEFSSFLANFNDTVYALRVQDLTNLDSLFDGLDLDTTEGRKLAEDRVLKIYTDEAGMKTDINYTADQAEKLFMKVMNSSKIGSNSIFLYQYENNQWKKLTSTDGGVTIVKTPCPQP